MKFECDVDVDFNGVVIFVYPSLLNLFGGEITRGQNILEAFTTTDKGDDVLDEGFALPIMGVDDGSYRLRFFLDESPEEKGRKVIFEDKFFYLSALNDVYVADMAVFWDWEDYTGWKKLPVPRGLYKVIVAGVHTYSDSGETQYGFDVCLITVPEAFKRTVEPRSDSRLV
jgi:hypothetical protein